MGTLKDAAMAAKGELYSLELIELEKAEVKDKTFPKIEKVDGKEVRKDIVYKVLVVNGKEYTIREKQLTQIKEVLEKKPMCKKIRFMKLDDGKIICLPLD